MQTLRTPKFGVIATIMETSGQRFLVALPKANWATSCEIRFDPLWNIHSLITGSLASCLNPQPTILTLRSKEDGGGTVIPIAQQFDFWSGLPKSLLELIRDPDSKVSVDWTLDMIGYVLHEKKKLPFPWEKIGASEHVFDGTPDDLPALLDDLEATPAQAFLKLVTMANEPGDLQRIEALFRGRTFERSRPLIAFGMGKVGERSRYECMAWGSAGTYGFIPGHQKAAPGQVSINDLLNDELVSAVLARR